MLKNTFTSKFIYTITIFYGWRLETLYQTFKSWRINPCPWLLRRYYYGIKAFNNLPTYVKNLLQTKKQFKRALKEYLHSNSFYSLNEFYNYNRP